MGHADTVKHEPSGFLSDIDSAGKLPRTNAVLAISQEPHSRKPLVQTERGVFKDRPDLHGELALRVVSAALPTQALLLKGDFGASAGRANYTVRPTARNKVRQTIGRLRESHNCFLKALWINAFHNLMIT
jgi:hypothetical protein